MTARSNRVARVALAAALALAGSSCGGDTSTPSSPSGSASTGITDDTALFRLFTATDPVSGYTVFPNADEYDTGRLNGSEAHRPVIRVRLNAIASAVLVNGRLPANTAFADGSIIVKEIRQAATTPLSLYAVMVKDRGNALAGNGWLWAEHGPSGSVTYSVNSRGGACTSCHLRERGPENDLVRTFERQR